MPGISHKSAKKLARKRQVNASKSPKRAPRKGVQKGGRPRRKKAEVFSFEALRWATAKQSRESLTRLMVAFVLGSVTESQLRVLTYSARALLPFFEFERGLVLDDRLDALEQRVEEVLKEARRES
ncbi:MAG: hypothetical protein ABSG85_16810 [Spirochaetia bacterium]|jgi:hypothetical protein